MTDWFIFIYTSVNTCICAYTYIHMHTHSSPWPKLNATANAVQWSFIWCKGTGFVHSVFRSDNFSWSNLYAASFSDKACRLVSSTYMQPMDSTLGRWVNKHKYIIWREKKVTGNNQHGFTEVILIAFYDKTAGWGCGWGRAVSVIYLNFSKTFWRMPPNILVSNLECYDLDGWTNKCIKNGWMIWLRG